MKKLDKMICIFAKSVKFVRMTFYRYKINSLKKNSIQTVLNKVLVILFKHYRGLDIQ